MGAVERSQELRLPTVAVPVRLALAGANPAPADVFVADTKRQGRAELLDDVADLLDQPAAFLPIQVGDAVRLYAKRAISWIALPRHDQVDPELDDPSGVFTLYDRQHRVEVALVEGGTLTGTLLDSSPASRPRVVDHLNTPGTFVRLWTTDEHYLINKAHIVYLRELAE